MSLLEPLWFVTRTKDGKTEYWSKGSMDSGCPDWFDSPTLRSFYRRKADVERLVAGKGSAYFGTDNGEVEIRQAAIIEI